MMRHASALLLRTEGVNAGKVLIIPMSAEWSFFELFWRVSADLDNLRMHW
jgi:hypothetical protein